MTPDSDLKSLAGPDSNASAAVEILGVRKRFGRVEALGGITARILPGRLTGLVGPDGAGKTTLMRLLAGLMDPTEGTIRVAGCDTVRERERIHTLTGYMPQRFGLYEDLTVVDNLHLFAELRGLRTANYQEVFERLLAFTRLGPFTGRLAGKLSGGMKQKLGLACALMARPQVLLLDEPGVGVDPVSRQDLWRMVHELTGEGMAVVWSTAYLDEAERCASVLLLNDGRVAYDGPPHDLTLTLHDRSYLLRHPVQDRRAVLSRALDLDSVCDGTIQGSSVRLVLRRDALPAAVEALAAEAGGSLEPVAPRFEDAFVDLLGGHPGGGSALARAMPPAEDLGEVAVSCRDLTRRFGAFLAADRVGFQVRRGEIFGLLGPNGAGKSTTFKMLCGLLKPTSGQAQVMGLDLRTATSAAKGRLGYMAQKFSLYGLLSVRQNLEFSAGVYGLENSARRERIQEMVDAFHLGPHLDAAPGDLALGFKQRLALACALMHRPPVLFLDEPTSGVDPITRREFWSHINGLVRKGVTVLVTTHFMEEAEYCDRVALMYRAKVIALDTPDALKRTAVAGGMVEPTMEDAFIHLVEQVDEALESAGERRPAMIRMPMDLRRLAALVHKESRQMWRDPATILMAFVLPVVMILLYAYAVSLDLNKVPVGVVLETDTPAAQSLAAAFAGSRYFEVTPARDRREVAEAIVGGRLRGFVVIPQDLDRRIAAGGAQISSASGGGALVQVVTDGSQPNTAGFVENYARNVVSMWQAGRGEAPEGGIALEPRFWYNPEVESRRFLLPGAIAIIMTMIGTLLTAMVVAREWERGTMEALISTPVSVMEILVGKLLPYFVLALAATAICTLVSTLAFGVPLRGSWLALLMLSSAFLVPALGQGLVISSVAKNQFVAAQLALFSGFLPAFLLSGFIFEISSMPLPIRILTYLLPARYFVASLQTVYLAGNVWSLFIPDTLAMLAIGCVFLLIARAKTKKTLDS